MINPFLDERPIPKLDINLKVKIKTDNKLDYKAWNLFFSYLMKKPKSKLTFIMTSLLQDNTTVTEIKYNDIKNFLSEADRIELSKVSNIFDNIIPNDLKIFILSMFQIPIKYLIKN